MDRLGDPVCRLRDVTPPESFSRSKARKALPKSFCRSKAREDKDWDDFASEASPDVLLVSKALSETFECLNVAKQSQVAMSSEAKASFARIQWRQAPQAPSNEHQEKAAKLWGSLSEHGCAEACRAERFTGHAHDAAAPCYVDRCGSSSTDQHVNCGLGPKVCPEEQRGAVNNISPCHKSA
jgi:hypothetical protein